MSEPVRETQPGPADTVRSLDVIPLGDTRKHTVPGDYDCRGTGWWVQERETRGMWPRCRCSPRVEPVLAPNGSLGTVHVHRAWDQRELTEQADAIDAARDKAGNDE